MTWRATVLTLFPAMFPGSLGLSLAGDALAQGAWSLEAKDIRNHGRGRHRTVDDTPAGGGPGMVLRADVVGEALDAVSPPDDPRPRILLTPRGRPLTQARVREIADGPGVVLLCGRFEGFDQRVVEARHLEEVSVGDFVLSGGEPAALVLLDACVRLLPGVMGHAGSGQEESFSDGLLEYPHYTRPREWEGRTIPDVLLSGDHGRIARWRSDEASALTWERRPDLLTAHAHREKPPRAASRSMGSSSRGRPSVETLASQAPQDEGAAAGQVCASGPCGQSTMTTIDFWYEFASTYSYPAAMRIEDVAESAGVAVRWRPFLLGPIFAAQGLTTSPFNVNAAKGANMWRDLERICDKVGLPFVRPDPFPQPSLLPARIATVLDNGDRPAFSRRVYQMEFGEGRRIDDADALFAILADLGLPAADVLAQAGSEVNKAKSTLR